MDIRNIDIGDDYSLVDFQKNLNDTYKIDNGISYEIHTFDIEPDKKEKERELTKEEIDKIKSESLSSCNKGKIHDKFLSGLELIGATEKDLEKFNTIPELDCVEILEDHTIRFDLETTDPYLTGRQLYDSQYVDIKPNEINVLIGCNGAGKTTMYHCLLDTITTNRFPVLSYDNLKEGGHNALESLAFHNEMDGIADFIMSSEGENITNTVFRYLDPLNDIIAGKYTRNVNFKKYRDLDHIFFLFDAVDSGFSIDNIVNLKTHFNNYIDMAKSEGKYLYIITTANSFEMARKARSWNVQLSKEMYYETDYDKYREDIIESRIRILKQWKEKESL